MPFSQMDKLRLHGTEFTQEYTAPMESGNGALPFRTEHLDPSVQQAAEPSPLCRCEQGWRY